MSRLSEALTQWMPKRNRVPSFQNQDSTNRTRLRFAEHESRDQDEKGSRSGPLILCQSVNVGEPVWAPRDYAAFAREGFMQNAIVYRSVRMIAEAAASIPLLLYAGDEEIETHPLLDLLRRPSLDHTGTDFLEAWYGFLLVAGNTYAEAVAIDGDIRELHILRPDRMKVIPGPDGWPEGYEYTACGQSVRFIDDVVDGVRPILHVKLFHPANDHYGMSPIEAAATAIDTHNTASGWNKALLDNSARPSGALVYAAANGQMTEDQFARLKSELETNFQGARQAGRPLLLEGGLDWKPLSLTPKDMDFMEAKNGAAREIALAIGVPPMLLGIPGDNTYANYAEAQRAFWRQTVLPLVNRTARAFSTWLAPAFSTATALGGRLDGGESPSANIRLLPDLDQIEALSGERDALWKRLEGASFLTDDEKRAAAGYGAREVGAKATGPFDSATKFNPYHDEIGRFTSAGGDAGGGGSNVQDTGDGRDFELRLPKETDGGADTRIRVAQARSGRGSRIQIGGQDFEATPAQIVRLSNATNAAEAAIARVREVDPNWRPTPGFFESVEGAIAQREGEARAAEVRLRELAELGPGTSGGVIVTPRGRAYTTHTSERATERNFTPERIDAIIDNNRRTRVTKVGLDGRKTFEYTDARGNTVVTNEHDGVVTVYSTLRGGFYIEKP